MVAWPMLAPLLATATTGTGDEVILREADRNIANKNWNQACQQYELAMQSGAALRNDYNRARNLGLCYSNANPPEAASAVRWLETALRLRPSADDTRYLLAQALVHANDAKAAIEHFRVLAASHPENAQYALGLSAAWSQLGGGENASAALQSFLTANPANANVRLQYARTLGYSKKFPEAMEQYKTVLRADPDNLPAQVGVAKVLSWEGDWDAALKAYNRILERSPSYYDARVGKAFTLLWMGNREEARRVFEAAARAMPGDSEVSSALEAMRSEQTAPSSSGTSANAEFPRTAVSPDAAVLPVKDSAVVQNGKVRGQAQKALLPSYSAAQPNNGPESGAKKPQGPDKDALLITDRISDKDFAVAAIVVFLLVLAAMAWRQIAQSRQVANVNDSAFTSGSNDSSRNAGDESDSGAFPASASQATTVAKSLAKEATLIEVSNKLPPEEMIEARQRAGTDKAVPLPPPVGPQLPSSDAKKKLVLIVGGNENVMEFERIILASAGIEVMTARNGEGAIRCLENRSVGAVLLHDEIGGAWTWSGLHTWIVSSRPEAARKVILACSREHCAETRGLAQELGIRCIQRPIEMTELIAIVEALLADGSTDSHSGGPRGTRPPQKKTFLAG